MSNLLERVSHLAVCDKQEYRRRVLALEDYLLTLPQLELKAISRVHGGMYCRELTMPADSILTGQIYKFDHFEVMIKGDISVPMENGEVKRLKGYNCMKAFSGKKRAVYVHEETTWLTFHPFSGDDGEEVQRFITCETFEELEEFQKLLNQADYNSFLSCLGISEEDLRKQIEVDDIVDFPEGYEHLYLSASMIEGVGFFSRKPIKSGDVICPSRIGDNRTPAGRYVNHALIANAEMKLINNQWCLVANRDIDAGEEITTNYRKTLDTRSCEGDLLCLE